MEANLTCTLDNNEVYKDKRYEIQVKLKNTSDQAWIMPSAGAITVSLPIGKKNTSIAATDQGIEITCGDLEVQKQEIGKWSLCPKETEYIIKPGQELSLKVSGENPYFEKTDTDYMSGILISYPKEEKEMQTICLPIYKVHDKLAICYFSVKGKNAKGGSGHESIYEVEYGEEITLQWEITRGVSYCVTPYNWKKAGEQEKRITIWHDTIFSLCVSDKETFLQQDIIIKAKAPGSSSFKSISAKIQEEKAVINIEYENASFSYMDRGVGKIGAFAELTDYDIGENYFLQFPEEKGIKEHVQIKGTETKKPRIDYFRYYYCPKNEEKQRYYAEWNVTGSNGKLYIEREGKTYEYTASKFAYFADTKKENALLNISAEDELKNKMVYHDIYPYEL